MRKQLLKNKKSLYKILDDMYNILPEHDLSKAVFKSKKEQYDYQLSGMELPSKYPCIIVYDIISFNSSDWTKPYLYNKNYFAIKDHCIITMDDFEFKNSKI